MDSDHEFNGIIGFFIIIMLLISSPMMMAWGAAMEIMSVMEQENRIRNPSDKVIFYCLGVYAVLVSMTGLVTIYMLLFLLVSWSASMIS